MICEYIQHPFVQDHSMPACDGQAVLVLQRSPDPPVALHPAAVSRQIWKVLALPNIGKERHSPGQHVPPQLLSPWTRRSLPVKYISIFRTSGKGGTKTQPRCIYAHRPSYF